MASTSRYRAELLARLGLPFDREGPGVDESHRPGETPRELAVRLARAKAEAVARRYPGAWCLGSDQVAVLGDAVLGKPATDDRCVAQLMAASGREVVFLTAACLANVDDPFLREHVDETRVRFRELAEPEVRRYVAIEQPLDCAGGFKCEGLGIALFDRIDSGDPTALIGLPLIWVARALREAGLDPLGETAIR
ncbi:MAG: Maf family nucleotide pyrophosphatase [Steroidobacteraceae bacterium]|nr:Maf family nucleotide pyrophosphatase [Steroidobacteraceae bacterium]